MDFHKDIPVKTSYELAGEVVALANAGSLIQAVKVIRDWTKLDLTGSKKIVDILRNEMQESYGWEYGKPLSVEDLDVLQDFTEGAIIGVYTALRPRRYPSVV